MSNEVATELIHFICPRCAAPLNAPLSHAGESMNCPACQSGVLVPTALGAAGSPAQSGPTPQVHGVDSATAAGEAPAPAVVSLVAPAPASEAAPVSPPAPMPGEPATPEAAVPLIPLDSAAQVPAEGTVPAEIPAQGMNIVADPAAVRPPSPSWHGLPAGEHGEDAAATSSTDAAAEAPPSATHLEPARHSSLPSASGVARTRPAFALRRRRVIAPRRPSGPPARKVVAVFAALIFIAVAAVIGISIANGIQRSRIEREISAVIANAETAFSANDISTAAQLAQTAQEQLNSSPQPLNPEMVKHWRARSGHFLNAQSEAEQLQAIYSQAEKDLNGARSRLEDKKSLYGPLTADSQPLVARVEGLLLDLAKLELKQKQQRLREELQKAEARYKDGKVEDAASLTNEVAKQLADKPAVQNPDLERRLKVLLKRGEQLKDAKEVRLAAHGGTYSEAKRKLQAQLDALDENNADLKPLYQRIAALKNELVQEEKRSRKLDVKEASAISAFAKALASRDRDITVGQLDGDGIGLTYTGKPLRMGLQRGALSESLFLEANGYRLLVDADDLFGRGHSEGVAAKPGRQARVLTHALALGEALKLAGVPADETWNATEEAPLPSARRLGEDGKEYIFLGDRLYVGKPAEKTESEKEVEAEFAKKAETLAVAVEKDTPTPEEVRTIVAVAVRAAYKDADWYDHLPGDFVRKVINGGYIESNMPGTAERLKKELADFRAGYARISKPNVRFRGLSSQGDEAVELHTYEEHAIWRVQNKAADTTTYAIKNPDDERGCLFILYDFPGKLADFPADAEPKTVRMTYQAIGVTASYDMAANKLTCEQPVWDRAVVLETPIIPNEVRLGKGFGPPGWCLPPHVLLVDLMGNTKGLVTPYGRLDVQNFNLIADQAKRAAAMDAYLKKMAKVLPTPNYLHLYFRYFMEYILDSPVTSLPNLLGSRAHCGDIHQTSFESLQRFMGGRFVGDCDDLAELFMTITRRQNKLSYVMSLPQHAACGYLEKPKQDNDFTFYVLDTGPPRVFKDKDMEKAIEKACRAYDDDKTMRFDPKSLGFLFRFAGEPTRSPYWLSSRMYVDPLYGEIMERVQSYWHFHFYALGIKTMTEMIEHGDRVPENCIELAGLYGQVREVESSIHWTNEAIKQFAPEQAISRMNEEFRIAAMWREERNNQKCYEALQGMCAELKRLESDPQSMNYLSLRLEVMALLTTIDRPWEAWDAVARDMLFLKNISALRGANLFKIEHAGGLTSVYEKMQRLLRKGRQPTPVENDKLKKIEELLGWFYGHALFEPEDDFGDFMRKYAYLGLWYAGKYGHERLVAELLKGGPFPDPAKPRVHTNRKDPEAEDWNWIRLSLPSYSLAIGDALDLDDPPEKWRRDEAVKLTDAMLKAAGEARQFGSLSSSEFQLLSARVFRACLIKDWPDLEAVLKETGERHWARLTADIAETFGRGARFITPAEFVAQYKVFARYIKSRTAYFTVVYEAYRADGTEHAVQASKVALDCWPADEDMKREAQYLEELAGKRQTRLKSNAAAGPGSEKVPAPAAK